jgi:hypothetical protein
MKIHNILHYPTPGPGTGNTVPDFPLVMQGAQQSGMMQAVKCVYHLRCVLQTKLVILHYNFSLDQM